MTDLIFLVPVFGLMGLGATGLWLRGQAALDDEERSMSYSRYRQRVLYIRERAAHKSKVER